MKKATTNRRPKAEPAWFRAIRNIEFAAFRVRRNPYAARIAREGIQIVHDAPSSTSLAEMPEADFTRSRVSRNRFAAKALETASRVQYGKGRPRKGSEVGPTPARSIRLPEAVWEDLENEAEARATTVHALLREVVLDHLARSR
jgi:hypothetical protein